LTTPTQGRTSISDLEVSPLDGVVAACCVGDLVLWRLDVNALLNLKQ
jgi:hypothetical protein